MLVTRLLLSAALTCAAAPTPAFAGTLSLWDHPGYDAEDSHFNPLETAITIDTIAKVTRKWQVKLRTDAESCSNFVAGPQEP